MDYYVQSCKTIPLGIERENLARRIIWMDILQSWKQEYGDNGNVELIARLPETTSPYPVTPTIDGSNIVWDVTEGDVSRHGIGECELRYTIGDAVVQSQIWATYTARSLYAEGSTDPPTPPAKAWFDRMEAEIGDLSELTTTDKSSLVAAINELAVAASGAGALEVKITKVDGRWSSDTSLDDICNAVKDGKRVFCILASGEHYAEGNHRDIRVMCDYTHANYRQNGMYVASVTFQGKGEGYQYTVTVTDKGEVTVASRRDILTPATDYTDGAPGLAPAPPRGSQREEVYLRADGKWTPVEVRVDTTLSKLEVPADAAATGARFASVPDLINGTGEQVKYTAKHPSSSDGVSYVKVSDNTPAFWELVGGNVNGYRLGGIPPRGLTISGSDYIPLTDAAYGVACSSRSNNDPGIAMCVVATGATKIAPGRESPEVDIPEAGIYLGSYQVGGRLQYEIRQLTYTANRKVAEPYLPRMSPLVMEVDWDEDGANLITSTTPDEFRTAMDSTGVVVKLENIIFNLYESLPNTHEAIFVQSVPADYELHFTGILVIPMADKLDIRLVVDEPQLTGWGAEQRDSNASAGGALTTPGNVITVSFSSDDPTVTLNGGTLYKISENVFPYQEFIGQPYEAQYTHHGDIVHVKGTFLPYNADSAAWGITEGWTLQDNGVIMYRVTLGESLEGDAPSDSFPIIGIFSEDSHLDVTPGVYAVASIPDRYMDGSIRLSYRQGTKILDYYLPDASRGNGLFWITISVDDKGTWTSDKTYAETLAAIEANLIPVCSIPTTDLYGFQRPVCQYVERYRTPDQDYIELSALSSGFQYHVRLHSTNTVTVDEQSSVFEPQTKDQKGHIGFVPFPSMIQGTQYLGSDANWHPLDLEKAWTLIGSATLNATTIGATFKHNAQNESFSYKELMVRIPNPQLGNEGYLTCGISDNNVYANSITVKVPAGQETQIFYGVVNQKFAFLSAWCARGEVIVDNAEGGGSWEVDSYHMVNIKAGINHEVDTQIILYGR